MEMNSTNINSVQIIGKQMSYVSNRYMVNGHEYIVMDTIEEHRKLTNDVEYLKKYVQYLNPGQVLLKGLSGNPSRIHPKELSMTDPNIIVKTEQWDQKEIESLVSLCILHGRSGILLADKNKATTANADRQWNTVHNLFNSIHESRNKRTLQTCYDFITLLLRKDFIQQRQYSLAKARPSCSSGTGNIETLPFKMTGPLQKLAILLGVPTTGTYVFGSSSLTIAGSSSNSTVTTVANKKLPTVSIIKKTNINNSMAAMRAIKTEIKSIPKEAADIPTAISCKANPAKRFAASSTAVNISSNGNNDEKFDIYKNYLAEQQRQASEEHAANIRHEEVLFQSKLDEIRRKALDDQIERDRRTVLHEMKMRHNETIFAARMKFLNDARTALAYSLTNASVPNNSLPNIPIGESNETDSDPEQQYLQS